MSLDLVGLSLRWVEFALGSVQLVNLGLDSVWVGFSLGSFVCSQFFFYPEFNRIKLNTLEMVLRIKKMQGEIPTAHLRIVTMSSDAS